MDHLKEPIGSGRADADRNHTVEGKFAVIKVRNFPGFTYYNLEDQTPVADFNKVTLVTVTIEVLGVSVNIVDGRYFSWRS